jgi:hypothetical protein
LSPSIFIQIAAFGVFSPSRVVKSDENLVVQKETAGSRRRFLFMARRDKPSAHGRFILSPAGR